MEITKEELRCADCCRWGLKRNKQGRITGEHICDELNQLRSDWQPVGHCSYFINRKSAPDLYGALKEALAFTNGEVFNMGKKALAKAEGK